MPALSEVFSHENPTLTVEDLGWPSGLQMRLDHRHGRKGDGRGVKFTNVHREPFQTQ